MVPTPAPRNLSSERLAALCLVLFVLAAAIYGQTGGHPFSGFDDADQVVNNPHVNTGFRAENVAAAFGWSRAVYWQPMVAFSHMLVFEFFGADPAAHHLVNLLLHAWAAMLLFWALALMTGRAGAAFFVAALFAVHPVNVESVAWVTERKNTLSALFWMAGLVAWAWYAKKPAMGRYLAVAACFLMGVMSKPAVITFPFVLLLLDIWPLGRWRVGQPGEGRAVSPGRLILEKIPLFLLVFLSLWISMASTAQQRVNLSALYPMGLRAANALASYLHYVQDLVFPQNLAFFYPFPESVAVWQALAGAFFLGAGSLAALLALKKRACVFTGWFWFIGTLVPVIGLVQTGLWPARADRFVYIPQVGLFLLAVYWMDDITRSRPAWRKAAFGAGVLACLILAAAAHFQVKTWKSDSALFTHATRVTKNNYVAYNNLGTQAADAGNLDRAQKMYTLAVQSFDADYLAHRNLGEVLSLQGRGEEAQEHFRRALEINPMDPANYKKYARHLLARGDSGGAARLLEKITALAPGDAEAWNNLGVVWMESGKYEQARACFSRSLEARPGYGLARRNLTRVQGGIRLRETAARLEKAAAADPQNAPLFLSLGHLYAQDEDWPQSARSFEKALALEPDNPGGRVNLGLALMRMEATQQARQQFLQVLEKDPENQAALYNLACLESLSGRPGKALALLERAVSLGFSDNQALQTDPDLEKVRSLPEFDELLKNVPGPSR